MSMRAQCLFNILSQEKLWKKGSYCVGVDTHLKSIISELKEGIKMSHKKTMLLFLAGIVSTLFSTSANAAEFDRIDTEGGTVTATSQYSGLEDGSKLFDGRSATKWLATEATPSVQLDFTGDEKYVVDNYSLTYANDAVERAPKDWTLAGSNDGVSWVTISEVTGEVDWELFEERSFTTLDPNSNINNTSYKMYKFDVIANNGSSYCQLADLNLYHGTEKLPSVTGVITSRSQLKEGEGILKAIDNDTATKWLSNNSDNDSWLMYQFINQPFAINGYSIASCNDAHGRDPHDWTFEASNDGETWTTLDTRSGESWSEYFQRRSFEFDNGTEYYYYRINMTSDSTLTGMSEFELLEIIDDPKISTATPTNLSSVAADPVVLSWNAVRETENATFNVYLMQGSSTVYEAEGISETQLEIPAEFITEGALYTWRVDIIDDPYDTGEMATFAGDTFKFRVLRQSEKVLEWAMDSFGTATTYGYETPVRDVSVTASSQEQDTRAATNTIDGYGLTVDPSITDPNGLQHSNNAGYMWISSPEQLEGDVWIQYDFDEPHELGTMLIWNHNVGAPYEEELNRGMRNVTITYGASTTDPNTWTTLGDFTIPMGTGLAGATPDLAVAFDGLTAQSVRITAAAENGNWGAAGTFHALSEVRFGLYNQPIVSYAMPDTSGHGNNAATYYSPSLDTEAISGTSLNLNTNGSLFLSRNNPSTETLPLGLDTNCYSSWSMNFYTLLPEQAEDLSFFVGFGDFDKGTGRYIAKFADGIHFWGGSDVDGVSNVPFDLNRWQMITATYTDGVLKMYKNAEEIFNDEVELGVAIPSVTVGGNTPWGETQLDGIFDEFTLYRGALTQTEIDTLYAAAPTQYDALNPTPEVGTVDVPTNPVLTWEAPLSAYEPTFAVYMGTDPESMTMLAEGLEDTTLYISDADLERGTTYYWYIDTSSGEPSATWSFTTVDETSAADLAFGLDFETTEDYVLNYEKGIPNITATASSFEQPSTWREPYKAVNGYGLTIDPMEKDIALGMSHSNQAPMGWCSAPDLPEKPWIKFEFDQAYSLGTMHVWNHNVDPTWASETDRGMRNVIISYGMEDYADPNDWTTLGNYEIPRGSNDPDFIPFSIAINFNGKTAKFVKIQAAATNSNWGNTNNMHGLAEVRFGIKGTHAVTLLTDDTSGNGNDGYGVGDIDFVTGIDGGTAVKLDGTAELGNEYFNAGITDASVLPLAADDQWTINMYVNLASNPVSPTLFGGMGGTGEGTGRFVGRFGGVHFWGGDNTDAASSTQYHYGQWQMVTAAYTGSTLTVYLNGEPVSTVYGITFNDADEFITVGGLNPWNYLLNASVDDYEIYSGVLTGAQIQALADRLPMMGDTDLNGTIDLADLTTVAEQWLSEGDALTSDFSGDATVNLLDFAILAEKWMQVK